MAGTINKIKAKVDEALHKDKDTTHSKHALHLNHCDPTNTL